ncbi:MAG: DUF2062 domain-containing protein [Deltaproteobacteria bacterium]|nr:DUF2062 domain-containing protein [Deltaproteobacteria bacterium]
MTQSHQHKNFGSGPVQKSPFKRLSSKVWEIFKEQDPPHKIALGLALGIFVGLLPIMGIQMAVVSMFALPLRGNLKAALAGVWISNPVTFIPLYWANYLFGTLFFPDRKVGWHEFVGEMAAASQWDWTAVKSSLLSLVNIGADVLIPLWAGSAILAVVFGILTYFLTFRWVVFYRKKRSLPHH